MRCNVSLYSCILPELTNDVGDALGRKPAATRIQEQGGTLRGKMTTQFDVLTLNSHRLLIYYKCQPISAALALNAKD
jgi:hypothetical protein